MTSRLTNILFCADDDGEDNQDGGGVSVRQSVRKIVIVPGLALGNTPYNSYNLIHSRPLPAKICCL